MAPPRRRLEVPLVLFGLAVAVALITAAALWSIDVGGFWFGTAEGVIVALLVGCAGVASFAVVSGRIGVRVWLAALMALGPVVHFLAESSGHGLSYSLWESERIGLLMSLACTVGAVGLVLRKSWARWLAVAAAIGGIGTSGLNIVPTLREPFVMTWIHAMAISFSTIVGAALVGPRVREEFETRGADGIWSSEDRAVRSIRWAVLSQLVAIPMLLVYAWIQPIVPQTQTLALVLAVVLGCGALLSMARKLVGAIAMVLGGPALLVLAGATAYLAHAGGVPGHLSIAGYYACFWGPAGLISTVAGIVLIRPVWRLWSRID